MSALNYTVFVEKVENGTKRQSIRAMRKRPFQEGERLHHFTGMRTTGCRRLRAQHEDYAKRVRQIEIYFHSTTTGKMDSAWIMTVDGIDVRHEHAKRIALSDGFASLDLFLEFFFRAAKPQTPLHRARCFVGQIVNW